MNKDPRLEEKKEKVSLNSVFSSASNLFYSFKTTWLSSACPEPMIFDRYKCCSKNK